MSRRAVLLAVVAAAVLAPGAVAGAAYDPHVELTVTGDGPSAPAAVTATLTQSPGDEATRTVETTLPGTFGFNRGFALHGCAAADERAMRCPDSSRIGRVEAHSPFGDASGSVFLTEDFRLLVVAEAYGGLVRLQSAGIMEVLPGQRIVVRFDGLPDLPTSFIRLSLDGGERTPLALPRVCGTHTIEMRLVSRSGIERRSEHPVTVTGCLRLPVVGSPRLDRDHAGRTVLRWRLRAGVDHTDIALERLAGGIWRPVGTRRVPARTGDDALALGRRWAGRRIGPGRYRLSLAAVAADGRRSLVRRVLWRVR